MPCGIAPWLRFVAASTLAIASRIGRVAASTFAMASRIGHVAASTFAIASCRGLSRALTGPKRLPEARTFAVVSVGAFTPPR